MSVSCCRDGPDKPVRPKAIFTDMTLSTLGNVTHTGSTLPGIRIGASRPIGDRSPEKVEPEGARGQIRFELPLNSPPQICIWSGSGEVPCVFALRFEQALFQRR